MKLNFSLSLFTAVSAVALVLSAPVAQAVPLVPGQSLTLTGANETPNFVGTQIADTGLLAFTLTDALGTHTAQGTIESLVYDRTGGSGSPLLDFYYQVSNGTPPADGPDAILSVSSTSFRGWATDVSYLSTAAGGSDAPTTVDRSSAGGTITFSSFIGGGPGQGIQPGETSRWLLVSTDASQYKLGSTQVLDGGQASVITFAPGPEPAAIAFFGIGLLITGAVLRKRFIQE